MRHAKPQLREAKMIKDEHELKCDDHGTVVWYYQDPDTRVTELTGYDMTGNVKNCDMCKKVRGLAITLRMK